MRRYFFPQDVIQSNGNWFFTPSDTPRPLHEMIDIYHKTAGRNTLLELDFAIDRTGRVDPHHRLFYQAFGGFLEKCYGASAALAEGALTFAEAGSVAPFMLELDLGNSSDTSKVDRVVIEENQTKGQLILEYRVVLATRSVAGLETSVVFANGTSVGTRRIEFVSPAARRYLQKLAGSSSSSSGRSHDRQSSGKLRLEVMATARNLPPAIVRFAAFGPCPCPPGSPPDATC
jgi:hypothetical protein